MKSVHFKDEDREILRDLVQRRGPDSGVIVRRQTRLGATYSDELLARIAAGDYPNAPVALTREGAGGETIEICICGIHHCDDGSVAG